MYILIIEDQKRLADSLGDIMKKNKHEVEVCYDGEQGYHFLQTGVFDVAILDVMLPKMNGFEVLEKVRDEKNTTPIVLLTAKSEVEDKVHGLDSGADYYLTKPFEIDELLASIRAVTRRTGELVIEKLTFGDIILNISDYTLTCKENHVRLGKKEFDIMRMLLMNQNSVIPKETILIKVWGMDSDAIDNNVEIYISFLRKKLQFLKSNVSVVTLRQCGYRLEFHA